MIKVIGSIYIYSSNILKNFVPCSSKISNEQVNILRTCFSSNTDSESIPCHMFTNPRCQQHRGWSGGGSNVQLGGTIMCLTYLV